MEDDFAFRSGVDKQLVPYLLAAPIHAMQVAMPCPPARLPACLLACPPAQMPTCPHACPPACLACLPAGVLQQGPPCPTIILTQCAPTFSKLRCVLGQMEGRRAADLAATEAARGLPADGHGAQPRVPHPRQAPPAVSAPRAQTKDVGQSVQKRSRRGGPGTPHVCRKGCKSCKGADGVGTGCKREGCLGKGCGRPITEHSLGEGRPRKRVCPAFAFPTQNAP